MKVLDSVSRSIGPSEPDDFLRLMCLAYELDFEFARPIFHSDPGYVLQNKRVHVVDSEIVACLTVVPGWQYLRGNRIPIVELTGIACLPSKQRMGYASTLIADSLNSAKSEFGALFGLVAADIPQIYDNHDWVACGAIKLAFVHIASLPTGSKSDFPVAYTQHPDLNQLRHLQNFYNTLPSWHGKMERDQRKWESCLAVAQGRTLVEINDGRQMVGYAVLDMRGAEINVLEIHTLADKYSHVLLDSVCERFEKRDRTLGWFPPVPVNQETCRSWLRVECEPVPMHSIMYRPNGLNDTVQLFNRLHDSIGETGSLFVMTGDSSPALTLISRDFEDVTIDAKSLLKLLFGAVSVDQLATSGRIQATEAQNSRLSHIFPPCQLALGPLDLS